MTLDEAIRTILAAGGIRGAIRLGPTVEHPSGCRIIIQGATPDNATHQDAFGAPIMVWVYDKPTDPATPAQQAQRAKVSAAAFAIRTFSQTIINKVFTANIKRSLTAQQAAMRYALTHPDLRGVPWDGFEAVWDDGATRWTPPDGEPWDAGLSWYDNGATAWT